MYFVLLLLHIAEILASILVIRTAAKFHGDEPVSATAQAFARSVLSKLTCFTCCNPKTSLGYQSVRETTPTETKKHARILGKMPSKTKVSPNALVKRGVAGDGFARLNSASTDSTERSFSRSTSVESPSSISLTDSTCSLDNRPLTFTWIEIASMLDRLFLMVFVFLRVLTLAVCLGVNCILCGGAFCVS